jgi:hypothetical protein
MKPERGHQDRPEMAIVFGIVGVLLGARHINAFPEMNCVKGLNVNLDSARIAGATRKLRTAIAANLLLLAYGVVRPSGLLFLSLSNAGLESSFTRLQHFNTGGLERIRTQRLPGLSRLAGER